jgi:cytochrome c peroxidase
MKLSTILALAGAAVLLAGLPAMAGEIPSVEMGRKLFNNPGLAGSTNGKTCNSCHLKGMKLEKAAANKQLDNAITRCILGPLGGKKFDGRINDVKALKMYIATLNQK